MSRFIAIVCTWQRHPRVEASEAFLGLVLCAALGWAVVFEWLLDGVAK